MSRKQPKRRAGNLVFRAIAGIFIFAIVCGVGFGVASADSSDDLARAGGFGFDAATNNATAQGEGEGAPAQKSQNTYREQSVLATTSKRTIDNGLKMIDDYEQAERERAEAEAASLREWTKQENASIADRVAAQKAKQGIEGSPEQSGSEYGLSPVDWTVGRDAFLEEWTSRIDAYLSGTALDGYGRVFAEAAWENGVDPRWSPAISNTESTNGAVCFQPCNAWGWGSSGWSDWETAIRAHVAGLGEVYGYCITPEAAAIYCPPNSAHWYANTFSQMSMI